MKTFTVNKHLYAECEYYETRYSWGHKGWLYRDGREIAYQKITYYNRTWEAYEFQSLLENLAEKAKKQLTAREYNRFKKLIDNQFVIADKKEVDKKFGMIATIASLGDIFGQTQTQKNDWKARMIKAGLENSGLIMPDDWNELSEDDKESRLNGVIAQLGEGVKI